MVLASWLKGLNAVVKDVVKERMLQDELFKQKRGMDTKGGEKLH